MKHLLFAGAALAALTSPAFADQFTYDWSGAYAGAFVGYATGDAEVRDIDGGVNPGPFGYSPSGAFAGGTLGYNVQLGSIVLGPELELGYMDLSGGRSLASSDPKYHQDLSLDGGLYGLAGGRIGFAFDKVLIYGKGGFAFYDGEGLQATTKPYYDKSGTGTFTGFGIGGGLEYAISPGISIKVEYIHLSFGDQDGSQTKARDGGETDDGTKIGDTFHNSTSLSADTVKAGVAFHF